MADFDAARRDINAARAEQPAARERLALARAALRQAVGAERVEAARAVVREADAARARVREQLGAAVEGFAPFSDPREQVGKLDDAFPCLLFPVRLETRFKGSELWVRIYPDTCLIDSFEATLAEVEVRNARTYWQGIWRAGGIEADERAAWRGLVASHGSGRAGFIVDTYQPANQPDEPVKAASTDVILVVAVQAPLPALERNAVATFWRAHWRADGAAVGEHAARTALETAVGAVRAAELVEQTRPFNLGDEPAPPLTRTTVASSVAFVVLPPTTTKDQPWTQAPTVDLLPDRFVLIAEAGEDRIEVLGAPVPSPLVAGPDPYAPAPDQLHQEDGDLAVPDELRWMVDFDRAVQDGLGFRVQLTPAQASGGFDRLYVLGLRLSADQDKGRAELEGLLAHHRDGRSGLSLLPQGTPTNNTEGAGTGFSRAEDADSSFDDRREAALFTHEDDWRRKQDGQWLAELLGIDPTVLSHVSHGGGCDQRDARAMQTALWPATVGYFLQTMMAPLLSDDDVEQARRYFTRYVSGRGAAPALRIGAQPYGILPTTAFSRIGWLDRGEDGPGFLARLQAILRRVDSDWAAMAREVPAVSRPGDAHQSLLGVLGLHPASAEFHYRYAESLQHLFNHLNLAGLGNVFWDLFTASALDAPALGLLRTLGHEGDERPAVLGLYFLGGQGALQGPLVDDGPLSESEQIRPSTTDGRTYLRWLVDAAGSSLDTLRLQSGFTDDKPPVALLYLLLRHALILGYSDAGRELHRSAGFDDEVLEALKREPAFVHVNQQAATSESRWAPLYKTEPVITQGETWTVAAQIAHVLDTAAETARLREQVAAIELLEDASTARLERALAEHVDCCTYRFDAWQLGLVNLQLDAMRGTAGEGEQDGEQVARTGVYLGAYGWLEDVRPQARELTPVELSGDLAKVFGGDGQPPLVRDSANGGYVHAPSLNQAVTAAVLRNGYLANASSDAPDALAVNLSSERVRRALGVLEGIRNGQSLASLLGYRLERGLHDRHALAEVDQFVFALRKAFPLRADRLSTTATDPGVSIEAIEARNVVDGLLLVEHVKATGNRSYPFGVATLPAADEGQRAAIDAEVDGLLDVHDALADLALAEGVHQAVQGNFDRVGATLTTYTTGQYPPEPEVVRTPATGVTLTHRIGLHLQPGLGPPAADPTPRSIAEPAVNRWLAGVLPSLDAIACRVHWADPVTGAPGAQTVTLRQLGLQPLDVLELVRTADQQAMTELDDRIVRRVLAVAALRPDTELEIRYMEHGANQLSVFEVAPLVAHVRSLLVRARPLLPGDVALPNKTTQSADEAVSADRARVATVKQIADALEPDLGLFLADLEPLLADQPNRRADLIAGIDDFVARAVGLLERAARLAIPETGWGFVLTSRRAQYTALVAQLRERAARWEARLVDFDARVHAYDLLPGPTPADERFALLQQAESIVSTTLDPLPLDPADLRDALDDKRKAFDDRRKDLADVADGAAAGLADLLADVELLLPLTAFDGEPFSLTELEDRIVAFAAELATAIASVRAEVKRRSAAAQDQLDAHDAAGAAPARVDALVQGARALLGEDFRIVPEFTVAAAQGDDWEAALAASTGGELFQYLDDETEIDFPTDEWLYGVARVREPLRHLEQAILLAGALGGAEAELTPIQLPHRPGERWLGLEFPADQSLDGDRVLYTAAYSVPFAKAAQQCGLLLDEWTEVVPGDSATTGIAFHYDQPNSEAPQAMLLVTPATWDGTWQWDDLTGALRETLELAAKRAVEPAQIDATAYARFLPATITAATLYGISIATAFAANNLVYEAVRDA